MLGVVERALTADEFGSGKAGVVEAAAYKQVRYSQVFGLTEAGGSALFAIESALRSPRLSYRCSSPHVAGNKAAWTITPVPR